MNTNIKRFTEISLLIGLLMASSFFWGCREKGKSVTINPQEKEGAGLDQTKEQTIKTSEQRKKAIEEIIRKKKEEISLMENKLVQQKLIVEYMKSIEPEFESLLALIEKSQDSQVKIFRQAVEKTLEEIIKVKKLYTEGGSWEILGELPEKFNIDNINNPNYYKNLVDGLRNYGYLEVSGAGPTFLATEFYIDKFPLGKITLVTGGKNKGFLFNEDGYMIVPGLKFYNEILEGSVQLINSKKQKMQ